MSEILSALSLIVAIASLVYQIKIQKSLQVRTTDGKIVSHADLVKTFLGNLETIAKR